MKEEALTEASSTYGKTLAVAKAKEGKTATLIANLLGVMPWQKYGGVVGDPSHLIVLAFDSGAVVGIKEFLVDLCGMKLQDAARIQAFNFQDDVRQVSNAETDWDFTLYNSIVTSIKRVQDKASKGKSSAVLVSSLTTVALALQRAIAGPPGNSEKPGGGMDQSKWTELGRQIYVIRKLLQQDAWHCIWEGHVFKPPETGQGGGERSETLQVQGASGHNFPNNVEQIFRIRRMFGETHEGTKVDRVFFDTQPSMDFISGGRLTTTNLDAKEFDLTKAYYKLGLNVGRWGYKPAKKSSRK